MLLQLGREPQQIIRFGEPIAQQLGLMPSDERSADEWLDLMVQYPILIERPIVVVGQRAVLGRPPEGVLEIIK